MTDNAKKIVTNIIKYTIDILKVILLWFGAVN